MEIYTGGAKPYAGFNNTMVMMKVASGYMIPKPADCPDDVYKLMVQCWAMEPDMRPRFQEMATSLASTYPPTTFAHGLGMQFSYSWQCLVSRALMTPC